MVGAGRGGLLSRGLFFGFFFFFVPGARKRDIPFFCFFFFGPINMAGVYSVVFFFLKRNKKKIIPHMYYGVVYVGAVLHVVCILYSKK